MQLFFSKIKYFALTISNLLLDNGAGRAKVLTDSGSTNPSGFSAFITDLLTSLRDTLLNVALFLLRLLARLAYFLAKITLNIIDLMNVVIKQLAGQASNYTIKNSTSIAENDILFKFLFNDITLRIFRAVLIFSILLLIIFTIMAIVKQEWQNHINGKQDSVRKVFKKVVLALFTLLVVPFVLVISIVFSNVLLASGINAITGGSGTYSIGAQVFSSSSYSANRYRVYAMDGKKIPIVLDYDGGFQNTVSQDVPTLTEDSTKAQEEQLKNMKESGNFLTGQSAYNMFRNETFYTFSSVPDNSTYYNIFDGEYLKTKQIEYYVMADFIDFAMQTGAEFYIENVEDTFMNVMYYINDNGFPDAEKKPSQYNACMSVLNRISAYTIDKQNIIDLNKKESITAAAENIVSGEVKIDYFTFDVYYNEARADALNTTGLDGDGKITYKSIAGSTNEVTGAKYIFVTKVDMDEYGTTLSVPVSVNDKINSTKLVCNFLASAPLSKDKKTTLRPETVFLARGAFTKAGYPTAIRQVGSDIAFYRQTPSAPSSLDYSEIFNYIKSTGNNTDTTKGSGSNPIADIVEFFSGVDVTTLVPDIRISLNFLKVFTKTEDVGSTLGRGKFTLNYSFVNSGLTLANVYDELQINYVVLLFACASIFMSLFYIIWALIQRLFEITLLWITFPGWVAKFPLDKGDDISSGSSYSKWKNAMIERVLALFSVYLALALILLLVPIVFQLDYITTFDIEETNLFGIFNADAANLVIKTAFVLALFNLLSIKGDENNISMPRLIEDFVTLSKGDPQKGYLVETGVNAVADAKSLKNKAKAYYTVGGLTKTVKGAGLAVARGAVSFMPGRAVAERIIDHGRTERNLKRRSDDMLVDAQNNLTSKTNEADIKRATAELNTATSDHEYMEGFRQAEKEYWRQEAGARDSYYKKNSRLGKIAKEGGGTKFKFNNKKMKERKIYKLVKKSHHL